MSDYETYDGEHCDCDDCVMEREDAYAESFEGDLEDALARVTQAERDAMYTAIKQRRPICVGTWAATGEKQSYTCLMGTVAAVLRGETNNEFVREYLGRSKPEEQFLSGALSSAGYYDVPSAFDNVFGEGENQVNFTVPAVGGAAQLLNERGRNHLKAILDRANANPQTIA